jgi:hypothetical protein
MLKAGFDTTVIPLQFWYEMLDKFKAKASYQDFNNSDRYTWEFDQGIIVTSHRPSDGKHYNSDVVHHKDAPGLTGYIGIEGEAAFVANVFVFIKEHAEFIKGEDFGSRPYI